MIFSLTDFRGFESVSLQSLFLVSLERICVSFATELSLKQGVAATSEARMEYIKAEMTLYLRILPDITNP
ncbi:hypothetical protein GOO54_003473 [Salmonella enterica]|nr:hypothetical protein [Salmonella enterica subsp. enterica serovar Bredeney]EAO6763458.1 hypothetical protein [Salmonella enterica]EBU7714665.1 hypothetical protein [Salmonella enterica subsp. enterica serovar Thompson]ECU9701767.1 hypothetical protein [Salmonella enterica subsp. enterica serovar Panama]EDF6785580.1 hypothetical protein [Salmonella enterica subsp. enterica serovar Senftenberg]EDK1730241.1 hypothetical protein [Salmonella enterica subsp. enterica serovar Infantis]EEE2460038.